MSTIGLVHLVRKVNGLPPFCAFLSSYRRYHAGEPHELIFLFKGFNSRTLAPYINEIGDLPYKSVYVPDIGYDSQPKSTGASALFGGASWNWGFDLRPYFTAVKKFDYEFFAFFNSNSRFLAENFLSLMYQNCIKQGVGAVGATGSWESMYTSVLNNLHFGPYSKRVFRSWRALLLKNNFHPFPNYHLRTNAFMVSRELLLKVKVPVIVTKMDAWRFESGVAGLSGQLLSMGKKLLVVGRDGRAYEKEQWDASRTYRSEEQQNLLVADNQTNHYMAADSLSRVNLFKNAWKQA